MRQRLRILLPVLGLVLFTAESYHSFREQSDIERAPTRYFWWSAIRLDTDPMRKRQQSSTPCLESKENCTAWELRDRWVDPGWLQIFLMFSAFPAFIIGGFAVRALGKLGISQLSSFMLLMPILILTWYYFVGWLLDRWHQKRMDGSGAA